MGWPFQESLLSLLSEKSLSTSSDNYVSGDLYFPYPCLFTLHQLFWPDRLLSALAYLLSVLCTTQHKKCKFTMSNKMLSLFFFIEYITQRELWALAQID